MKGKIRIRNRFVVAALRRRFQPFERALEYFPACWIDVFRRKPGREGFESGPQCIQFPSVVGSQARDIPAGVGSLNNQSFGCQPMERSPDSAARQAESICEGSLAAFAISQSDFGGGLVVSVPFFMTDYSFASKAWIPGELACLPTNADSHWEVR